MADDSQLSAEAVGQLLSRINGRLQRLEDENAQLKRRLDALQEAGPSDYRINAGSFTSMQEVCTYDSLSSGTPVSSALEAVSVAGGVYNMGRQYMFYNQMAYAIAALPIGTVLSIGPLFLKSELGVPVRAIGYIMMGGELLGIVFMKWAEVSFEGFVLQRPHDVHFILFSVAMCLFAMPLWPSTLWVGAAASMLLVQAFNSASKPVVAEAVYRLAVLMERDPSTVYAEANKWRRMGNAIVGASTPLAYMASPSLAFFVSAPILAIFTLGMYRCKKRIDLALEQSLSMKEKLRLGYNVSPSRFRLLASPLRRVTAAAGLLASWGTREVGSEKEEDEGAKVQRSSTIGKLVSMTSKVSRHLARDSLTSPSVDHGTLEKGSSWLLFLLFLTIHAFPFMDAFISRLPFTFLTIAILDQSGELWVACIVLFSYQSCRAIGQSIQTYKVNSTVNYLLTFVSVVAYAVVLICVVLFPDFQLWFLPIILTGFSETLPVQQFYLGRLLRTRTEKWRSEEAMRDYVKKSHTGTGIGSAAAFFSSAFVYGRFGLLGVGLLGEAVAVTKLALVVFIGTSIYAGAKSKTQCKGASTDPEGCSEVAALPQPHSTRGSLESDACEDPCGEDMYTL